MVKNHFFEVTQSKCYKLIWLLKVYIPSNKTEAVLFITKTERADPNMGVNHTPEIGCFFQINEIQHICFFITQLIEKLQQWSLYVR